MDGYIILLIGISLVLLGFGIAAMIVICGNIVNGKVN